MGLLSALRLIGGIHRAARRRRLVVLGETALLGSHLALIRIARGEGIIIVNGGAGVGSFAFAAGSRTKRIQLGSKLCLRLNEGAAVIAHGLVPGIRVLREQGEARRDEDHQKEDKRKDGIVDEEYNAHGAGDNGLQSSVAW